MDTRRLAVSLILVTMAGLLFLGMHPRGDLRHPTLGNSAAAQTANSNIVQVKHLPNFGTATIQPWERFEITAPTAVQSLDMHVGFLIDGHGTEYVAQRSASWPQPISARLWVDCGDYKMVDAFRPSHPQPQKEQKVNFDFVAERQISFGENKTLKFVHGTKNRGVVEVTSGGEGAVGDKIPLYNREIEDTAFHGYSQKWRDAGYVSKFPLGMVHRLTVYVQFLPHQGAPMRTSRVIKRTL